MRRQRRLDGAAMRVEVVRVGVETVTVPIDHGQPWVYDPKIKLF